MSENDDIKKFKLQADTVLLLDREPEDDKEAVTKGYFDRKLAQAVSFEKNKFDISAIQEDKKEMSETITDLENNISSLKKEIDELRNTTIEEKTKSFSAVEEILKTNTDDIKTLEKQVMNQYLFNRAIDNIASGDEIDVVFISMGFNTKEELVEFAKGCVASCDEFVINKLK
jgi:peptidoglycan hydrolase CwlO-like protein